MKAVKCAVEKSDAKVMQINAFFSPCILDMRGEHMLY